MTKNPILNALTAIIYIALVASVMFYGSQMVPQGEDTVMAPIALISLFTLSAAVMGYIFLYQPLQLFLEGDKIRAVNLFIKTLITFAIITAIMLALLFSSLA